MRQSSKNQTFDKLDLTKQGVLDLNLPTEHWMNHVEKKREDRMILACLRCGGLGWFKAPGTCPGCTDDQMREFARRFASIYLSDKTSNRRKP